MRVSSAAVLCLSLLASTAAVGFGFGEQPAKGVDLGGSWQINASLSDDIPKLVAEQRVKMRNQRDKERRRRPSRAPGADLYPTEEEAFGPMPAQPVQRPELSIQSYSKLTIAQTSDHFIVESESPSGHVERESYDPGEKSVVSFGPGVADRQAGWKGKNFVVETHALSGARRVETFALDPANHLVVLTLISGRGPKLEVKQIYDRVANP